MRLLIISPLFPPLAIAEAPCSGLFVQALRRAGVDVQVIMASDALPNLTSDPSACWSDLADVVQDVRTPPRPTAVARMKLGLEYQILSWTTWTREVVARAERLHRAAPFSAVMSRSIPTQAHYAGFWISRRLRIPWLVNVNDPLDFSPFVTDPAMKAQWTPGTIERLWHLRILRSADLVTFPCERLRTHVLRGAKRTRPTADVAHIGVAGQRRAAADRFLIVHAGRLSDNTSRSADTILDGILALREKFPELKHPVTIRFVGPSDAALLGAVRSRGLDDVVEFTGPVSFEESLEHISEATVCLLVEGDLREGVFLPSKLCHYLAAGKPIVALSPPTGTTADLAEDGGITLVRRGDANGAARAFGQLFQAFVSGQLDSYRPSSRSTDRFRSDAVTRQFFEALGSCEPIRGALPSVSYVS